MEGEIFVLGHRAVDVIAFLVGGGSALVPARLNPADLHVDALAMDDGCDGIEECQPVLPGGRDDALRQRLSGQRTGGHDGRAFGGQRVDPLADDGDIRVRREHTLDLGAKCVAIDRHCRACGHSRRLARAHDQAVEPAHLVMQQPDRVLLVIVGTEGIGAHQLGEPVGVVRGRGVTAAAHFGQADTIAALRQLPGRFASGEAAADDVDVVGHCRIALEPRGGIVQGLSVGGIAECPAEP